ncbi:hypothetical protein ABBQ38_012241 [Trebouxia sp. C0009 RCD-2024]
MAGAKSVGNAQLTVKERCIAAAGAALVAAVVVNPLDVVKTRMQTHANQASTMHRTLLAPLPSLMNVHQYALGTVVPGPANLWGQAVLAARLPQPPAYRSCIDGLWKIARHEGASVLWHGVNVSMLISVPMICMYLPMYDNLMAELGTSTTYAPLVAGSAARSVAVVATSPLELLKTRIQAAGATTPSNSKVASSSINPMSTALQQMRSDLKGTSSQRVSSLWRGVGASLIKDVPFAGLYWTLMEPSRSWLDSHTHIPHSPSGIDMHTLGINALAGSSAGAAAAAVTTPLDVVKTRLQTRDASLGRKGTFACLRAVAKQEGIQGLFSGWGPRTLRTAAAYGILMSSYEICKGVYGTKFSD